MLLLLLTVAVLVPSYESTSDPGNTCFQVVQRTECESLQECLYFEERCGCGVPLRNVDVAIVTDYPTTLGRWNKFITLLKVAIERLIVGGTNNRLAFWVTKDATGSNFEQIFDFNMDPSTFLTMTLPWRHGIGGVHSCAAISAAILYLDLNDDGTRVQKFSVAQFTDDEVGCTISPLPKETLHISGCYDLFGASIFGWYTEQMTQLDYEKMPGNFHVSEVDHYFIESADTATGVCPAFFSEHWCEDYIPTMAPTFAPTRGPTTPDPTMSPIVTDPTKAPTQSPDTSKPTTPSPTVSPSVSDPFDPECVPPPVDERSKKCDHTCSTDDDEYDVVFNGRVSMGENTTFCYQVSISNNGNCADGKTHALSHFSIRAGDCCVYDFTDDLLAVTVNGVFNDGSDIVIQNDSGSSYYVKYDRELAKGTSNEVCYIFDGDIGEDPHGLYCTKSKRCNCDNIVTWDVSDFTNANC